MNSAPSYIKNKNKNAYGLVKILILYYKPNLSETTQIARLKLVDADSSGTKVREQIIVYVYGDFEFFYAT